VVTGAITSAFVTRAEAQRREVGRGPETRGRQRPRDARSAEAQRREVGDDPMMQRLEDLSAQLEQIKAELARSRPGAAG
jgi:hypothetical protein